MSKQVPVMFHYEIWHAGFVEGNSDSYIVGHESDIKAIVDEIQPSVDDFIQTRPDSFGIVVVRLLNQTFFVSETEGWSSNYGGVLRRLLESGKMLQGFSFSESGSRLGSSGISHSAWPSLPSFSRVSEIFRSGELATKALPEVVG